MSPKTILLVGLLVGLVVAGSFYVLWVRSRQRGGCGLSEASFGPWAKDKPQVLDFYPDPNASTELNITRSRFTLTVELLGNSDRKVFDLDSRTGSNLQLRSEFSGDRIDFGNSPANKNFTFRASIEIGSADPSVSSYRFFGDDNVAEIRFSLGHCHLSSYSGSEFSQNPKSNEYAPEFSLGNELTFTLHLSVWIAD